MTPTAPLRHRLLPTRGRSRPWYVWGAVEALREAEAFTAEHRLPVMVLSAPVGGVVSRLYVVGGDGKPAKR